MIQMAAIAVKAGITKPHGIWTCALHPTVAEEIHDAREVRSPGTGGGGIDPGRLNLFTLLCPLRR